MRIVFVLLRHEMSLSPGFHSFMAGTRGNLSTLHSVLYVTVPTLRSRLITGVDTKSNFPTRRIQRLDRGSE